MHAHPGFICHEFRGFEVLRLFVEHFSRVFWGGLRRKDFFWGRFSLSWACFWPTWTQTGQKFRLCEVFQAKKRVSFGQRGKLVIVEFEGKNTDAHQI